jgi:hypothetical protein
MRVREPSPLKARRAEKQGGTHIRWLLNIQCLLLAI